MAENIKKSGWLAKPVSAISDFRFNDAVFFYNRYKCIDLFVSSGATGVQPFQKLLLKNYSIPVTWQSKQNSIAVEPSDERTFPLD
ncbi:MAG: hypothetical protein AAFX52_02010 [Pseudomonadota bacterium]